MAETLEFEIKLKKNTKDLEDAGTTFSNSVAKGLQSAMTRLGLGNVAIPIGGGGGGASGEATNSGMKASIAGGVAAGIAAAGVVGLLKMVADVLADFPVITGIMKILKMIMTLLFMPLIPILKPVLILLAGFTKSMSKVMLGLSKSLDTIMGVTIMPIVDTINNFFALMGAGAQILWSAINALIKPLEDGGKWLHEQLIKAGDMFYSFADQVTNILKTGWSGLAILGKWVWDLVTLSFSYLANAGVWIWNNILKPSFGFLSSAGIWIWNSILQPSFKFLANVGSWIWGQILQPAFNYLKDVGTWIWGILKTPFDWLASVIQSVSDTIKDILGKIGIGAASKTANVKSVKDFLITPGGTLQTDPNDFIIGTKNPGSMGGQMTVNINIDKPTVGSTQDIKQLVQAISLELYKQQRRFNSYA